MRDLTDINGDQYRIAHHCRHATARRHVRQGIFFLAGLAIFPFFAILGV